MTDQLASRSRSRSLLVIVLIASQVIFLLGLTGSYYNLARNGQEIYIKTLPLQGYDYYGDEVHLTYEISELNYALWQGEEPLPEYYHTKKKLYVVLRPEGDTHNTYTATGVYDFKPTIKSDEVMLKARLLYSYNRTLFLQYGFERFIMTESKQKELKSFSDPKIAVLKVSSSGKAIMIDLLNTLKKEDDVLN